MDLNYVGKFVLSEVTRDHGFKVVLTGEGADEHFAGYIPFVAEFLREPDLAWPHGVLLSNDKLRQELLGARDAAARVFYDSFGSTSVGGMASGIQRQLNSIDICSANLVFRPPVAVFSSWVRSIYGDLDPRATAANNVDGRIKELIQKKWHPLHSSLYVWTKVVLANNLLSCLGDRVEMAHSVEARTPFLDHHLTEYVNALPPSVKVRCAIDEAEAAHRSEGKGKSKGAITSESCSLTEKWILREATRPFITDETYRRRKHPYTAPVIYPTGGPLHRLLQKLLTKENIDQLGFLDWDTVESHMKYAFPKDAEQGGASSHTFRGVLMSAQLVILGQKFGVKRADPEIRV
jgi:asparagine synthase (glutamine-hydrolysing)